MKNTEWGIVKKKYYKGVRKYIHTHNKYLCTYSKNLLSVIFSKSFVRICIQF